MPGITEEDRKKILKRLEESATREAQGAALKTKEDKELEQQNQEIREKLAEGAEFEPPKEEGGFDMSPRTGKKPTDKQAKTFKSIKDEFKWGKLRKHLFGN